MSKSWLNLSRILFYLFFLQFSPKISAIRWSVSSSFWIAPMCREFDTFSGHFWLLRKRRMYKWKMKRPNHLFTAFWEFASRLQSIKFCNFSYSLFIWLLWTAHFLYGNGFTSYLPNSNEKIRVTLQCGTEGKGWRVHRLMQFLGPELVFTQIYGEVIWLGIFYGIFHF